VGQAPSWAPCDDDEVRGYGGAACGGGEGHDGGGGGGDDDGACGGLGGIVAHWWTLPQRPPNLWIWGGTVI